jgi:hypothetical protein
VAAAADALRGVPLPAVPAPGHVGSTTKGPDATAAAAAAAAAVSAADELARRAQALRSSHFACNLFDYDKFAREYRSR